MPHRRPPEVLLPGRRGRRVRLSRSAPALADCGLAKRDQRFAREASAEQKDPRYIFALKEKQRLRQFAGERPRGRRPGAQVNRREALAWRKRDPDARQAGHVPQHARARRRVRDKGPRRSERRRSDRRSEEGVGTPLRPQGIGRSGPTAPPRPVERPDRRGFRAARYERVRALRRSVPRARDRVLARVAMERGDAAKASSCRRPKPARKCARSPAG